MENHFQSKETNITDSKKVPRGNDEMRAYIVIETTKNKENFSRKYTCKTKK